MKRLVTLLLTILFLTGCSPIFENTKESIQYPIQTETSTAKQLNIETTKQHNHSTTKKQKDATTKNSNIQSTTKLSQPDNNETIEQFDNKTESIEMTTFIIDDMVYELPYQDGQTVYTAMMTLSAMSAQPFSFKTKEYPGLGFFVYEINGIAQDNRAGLYWIYYINNESAKTGISNYIIQQGDIIEWKYEKSTF